MKQSISLLILLTTNFIIAKNSNPNISINAIDSIRLNVISVKHEDFPEISVIFEAINNQHSIIGLEKEQLIIKEDFSPCSIISLNHIDQNQPINISLVIDHSGSMSEDYRQLTDSVTGLFKPEIEFHPITSAITNYPDYYIRPIESARMAVKNFLRGFTSPTDSLQIIGFSSTVDVVSEFSSDHNYLETVVNDIKTDYHTAFFDALHYSIDGLKNKEGINIIVALTDGVDNSSSISAKDIIAQANKYSIPIYNIGLGDVNKGLLNNISNKTNGSFYYTNNSHVLDDIYQNIHDRIKSIYNVTYESNITYNTDTLKKLQVILNVDSLKLTNNNTELNLPKESIASINNEKSKEQKKAGLIILISLLAFVVTGSTIRRRKKIKNISA